MSGFFTAQSGRRSISTANSATLAGARQHAAAQRQRDAEVLGGIGPGKLWFDTSVFSAPAQNTWGNVQRNSLLDGPGYVNVDATLAKRLVLPRGIRGEFRIDAFNVFNIPHFNNPNGVLGNANFGKITSVPEFSERLLRFTGFRVMF